MFHTYGAHPAACAASDVVLDILEREGLVERAANLGVRLTAALEANLGQHPQVAEIRGLGLLQGGRGSVKDRETLVRFEPESRRSPLASWPVASSAASFSIRAGRAPRATSSSLGPRSWRRKGRSTRWPRCSHYLSETYFADHTVGPARGRALLPITFDGEPGPLNAITDLAGVEVGYRTLVRGEGPLVVGQGPVRTGVTAIFPRGKAKADVGVFAGMFSQNGCGELTGSHWVAEVEPLRGADHPRHQHPRGRDGARRLDQMDGAALREERALEPAGGR